MAEFSLEQAVQAGMRHHEAGRLAEAEAIYRQVLSQQPNHSGALHLLGVIAHQVGRHDVALELIAKAITITPYDPAFHSNQGEAFRSLRRFDQAVAAYSTAIQ